jgi:DNA invertase Pin-like site-specific DNA recombinase
MKPIVAYIRVSSREQGKSGIGLKVQDARIRGYAEASNVRIVRVYQEVGSAIGADTLAQRSQLQAALKHARRLKCPLVIATLDRLARDAKELERLVSVPGTEITIVRDSDRLIRMRADAAGVQKQTELLKSRTSEGIRLAKKRGVVFGNQKNLSEAQKKGAQSNRDAAKARLQDLAPIIAGIRAAGVHSGAEIARRLNRLGNRTARGQEWTDQNLRRHLRQIDRNQKDRARSDAADRKNPNWGIM